MPKRAFPRRAIHLDFHTLPGIPDLGEQFDCVEFGRTLADCGVEYINVFARCNLGFAYYPTKIGITYPDLKRDLLGEMIESCHACGIGVSAYFNIGLDHEHMLRHRDWCRLDAKGAIYDVASHGHFFRAGCINTGYGPYNLAMIREVVENYPVDGIFLDCMSVAPCYGVECIDGMTRLGIDVEDESAVYEYARSSYYTFMADVEKLVQDCGENLNVIYNGMSYKAQQGHTELEVLPGGGWGYDYLPAIIRYARTLGNPYITMTGRFHNSWGDFGGLRPTESALYDCLYSIANGGTCSIGDHLHPCGRLEPAVYGMVKEVYAKTSRLDPWTDGAKSFAEVAIVDPALSRFPESVSKDVPSFADSVRGAARMLSELKVQYDVCDGEGDLSEYSLLILPDSVTLEGDLKEKVRAHLANGGTVTSSGTSGLDPDEKGFALPEYRMAYEGACPFPESYYRANSPVSDGIPDMLHSAYRTAICMTAGPSCETLAEVHDPYFSIGDWDRRHMYLYAPPTLQPSGGVAVARSGNIIHIAFPIFGVYFEFAPIPDRTLIGNCLRLLLPKPCVIVENMPSFGQVTLTDQSGRRMVHLLAYVPETRGASKQIVEEPITVESIFVSVRLDGRSVERVYVAPDMQPLSFEIQEGHVRIPVARVTGYALIVIEYSA